MADTNADTVAFELVSPTRLLVSEPVEMVVVPGTEGDIGVLPGHAPLIITVRPGIIDIHADGKIKDRIFVGGGFAEVARERCTVLAEEATPVGDIDRAEAQSRLAEARSRLAEAKEKTDAADEAGAAEAARQVAIAEGLVAAAGQAYSKAG